LVPDCPAELRVNGTREAAEMGWPVVIDGITLDIADDPNGGVKHAIAAECVTTYRLQDLTFEPGDVVIDVGAHVGVVSCYLAKKWPGVRVYAIEPVPANYERLERNIQANDLGNVLALPYAATADGRDLVLTGDPGVNTGHYSAYAEHGPVVHTAPSTTLSSFFQRGKVDRIALLKLDCEGLYGMGDLLARVDRLVMEVHENAALTAQYGSGAALVEYAQQFVPHVRASVIRIPDRGALPPFTKVYTADDLVSDGGPTGMAIAAGRIEP
jgi:FkbM family methyltransferase